MLTKILEARLARTLVEGTRRLDGEGETERVERCADAARLSRSTLYDAMNPDGKTRLGAAELIALARCAAPETRQSFLATLSGILE